MDDREYPAPAHKPRKTLAPRLREAFGVWRAALTSATSKEVYAWVVANRPDLAAKLPGSPETFEQYVARSRPGGPIDRREAAEMEARGHKQFYVVERDQCV